MRLHNPTQPEESSHSGLSFERLTDALAKLLSVGWLLEKLDGTQLCRLFACFRVTVTGDHDDRHPVFGICQFLQQLKPVVSRHPNVKQQASRL